MGEGVGGHSGPLGQQTQREGAWHEMRLETLPGAPGQDSAAMGSPELWAGIRALFERCR